MIRDSYSNALIETDKVNLTKYRKEKKREQEFQQMKIDIEILKNDINKLKAQIDNKVVRGQ